MNNIVENIIYNSSSFVILFTLFIPLAAAFLCYAIKNPKYRDICTVLMGVTLFINVINMYIIGQNNVLSVTIIELLPDISIAFEIDAFGMIFALVASFLWIVTSIYANGYMNGNNEKHQPRFYIFFALSIFAAMGIAMAGNMFTLFLFYEFLTLCTFPLVTHSGTEAARKSGRIYLGILLGTSLCFLLPAIIWTFSLTGTLDFDASANGILSGKAGATITGILLFLYVYGIGKAALMPIHRWLPAAMVAPTPVSALLHAVAVVKAGVFTLVKVIIYIFGIDNLKELIDENWFAGGWLIYIAGFTIISASVIALRSDNLKRRLAYSTISQLSYVIMAVAIFSPLAVVAAAFHIVAHAVGKITLFFAAGSIYTASGKTNVSQLNGIAKRMPYTMAAFTIAALSMIGLPPAIGFLTKYYMLLGAFTEGQFFAIIVIILSTLLNAAYFLPIIFVAYFKDEDIDAPKGKEHGEAPKPIVIPLCITAALVIGLFLFPDIFIELAKIPAGL